MEAKRQWQTENRAPRIAYVEPLGAHSALNSLSSAHGDKRRTISDTSTQLDDINTESIRGKSASNNVFSIECVIFLLASLILAVADLARLWG